MIKCVDPLEAPRMYDSALRWLVPSESDPHAAYLIDFGSLKGNGECQCKNFECARRPFLTRGKSPAWAVENGLEDVQVEKIKLKPGQRVEDALRCKHIMHAFFAYAQLSIDAQVSSEAAHGA